MSSIFAKSRVFRSKRRGNWKKATTSWFYYAKLRKKYKINLCQCTWLCIRRSEKCGKCNIFIWNFSISRLVCRLGTTHDSRKWMSQRVSVFLCSKDDSVSHSTSRDFVDSWRTLTFRYLESLNFSYFRYYKSNGAVHLYAYPYVYVDHR